MKNILYANVYKGFECDHKKCPIPLSSFSKSQFFGDFGPWIKHCLHWINFFIFTFLSEKNRYFKCLHKIWNKIISFDMKKKGEM
jgi:hypothetical protein